MTKNRIHIPYCCYMYLQSRCVEDFLYNCKLWIREIWQYSVKQFCPKAWKRDTDIARPAAPGSRIGPGENGTIKVPIWSNRPWSRINWILTTHSLWFYTFWFSKVNTNLIYSSPGKGLIKILVFMRIHKFYLFLYASNWD